MENTKKSLNKKKITKNKSRQQQRGRELPEDLEKEFSGVFKKAPFGLVTLNLRGRILSCNEALCRISGYTRQDFVGKHFTQIPTLFIKDFSKFRELFQDLVRGEFPAVFEFPWRHKDGSKHLAESYFAPVKVGMKMTGIHCLVLDVTEKKRADRALRESEKKFRSIVESSPMGMHMYELKNDGNLVFTGANSAADKILGLDNSQFIGKTIEEAFPPLANTEVPKRYRLAAQKGTPWQTEQIDYQDEKIRGAFEVHAFQTSPGQMAAMFLDVTERKRMEENLTASEAKYKSLVDEAGAGIAAADLKGRLIYVNDYLCKTLGYSQEELIGEPFARFLHPDEKKRIMSIFWNGFKNPKRKVDLEFRAVRKDGKTVWMYSKPTVHWLEKKIIGFNAIISDITERKNVEDALKQERNLLSRIAETSPAGIAVVDKQGQITFANRRAEEILGLSRSKITSRTYNDPQWRITDFDGNPFPDHKLPFSLVQKKGRSVYGVKHAIEWPKGKRVYLSINASPLLASDGSFEGMVAVIEDVSEQIKFDLALKESEEKYRNTVELSPDAIALVNLKGVVTDCNSALVRLIGASKEEIVQKHFTRLPFLYKKDIPGFLKTFSSLLTGKVPEPFEVRWVKKDGQPVDGEIMISHMKKDGRLSGIQVIARDITERKLSLEKLEFRAEFERLLLMASTRLINVSPDEIDEAINEILKDIGEFSDVDRSYIFLLSEDGLIMDNTHEWCAKGIGSQIQNLKGLPTEYFSWSLDQMRKREILHIPRVRDLPAEARPEKKEFEKEGILSLICVPILKKEKAIGFIGFDSVKREKSWSEDNIILLRLIADALSNAIDRVQKERELRLSEEKFRTLAENSPNMIFINSKGKVVFANKECERVMGYSREEFLSPDFDFFSLISPQSMETVKSKFAQHVRGRDVSPYEYTLVTRNGTYIDVIISSKLISYGEEMAILGVVTDITARKKGEMAREVIYRIAEKAREVDNLDDLYQKIHHSIADVMPAESNFYIALLNESENSLEFPYFVDEFEVNPGTQTLGKGLTEYVLRSGLPLLASPEVFEKLEAQGAVESVGPPSVDWLGVPLKVKEKTIGVMVTQTYSEGNRFTEGDKDLLMMVSEQVARVIERKRIHASLKESERKYRELYEGSRDASVAVDMNGRIIEFNTPFQEMMGYETEEILRLGFEDITPERWQHMEKEILETQVKRRGYSDLYEKELIGKNGMVFPVELRTYLSRDAHGHPTGMWAIVRDISERKKIEKEIMDSRERLRSLTAHLQSAREQERTNIAREIHDEMGQTLTALKMDLAMISRKMPQQPEMIKEKIKSMSGLIDSAVRSMKRISTELRPGLLDDFGLSAAMEWQAEEFKNRTGIQCQTLFKPKEIVIDRERTTAVFRIFQEALTNIARHAQATKTKVLLKKGEKYLELTVSDNGRGITEEKISSSRSFGLMGMRERVTFMQGELKIFGEKSKGTTITARIPL